MRYCYLLVLCMLSGFHVFGQTLAELEKELDSMIKRSEKSDFVIGMGYGNNPAYDSKLTPYATQNVILKPFLSPSITYYHKSGFNASLSNYYLFNANSNPWFEWDLSAGYDYTKSRRFLAGVNYTKYLFTKSHDDIIATPIKNELFAYGVYRDWWLEPGLSVDFGWGKEKEQITKRKYSITHGQDINFIASLRHDFMFLDVLRRNDAILLTPTVNFIAGTANYSSEMEGFQYVMQSKKAGKLLPMPSPGMQGHSDDRDITTGFEARAVDLSLRLSYIIGRVSFAPSYTVFKVLQNTSDNSLSGFFTAHVSVTLSHK